jgi:N6-L-threonylcarbamoyladenine synthase
MESLGLAIDTTFDDTSIAVLRGRYELLANLTLSQYADHSEFGGVVPERASRKHLEAIHFLIQQALGKAAIGFQDLHWVAVSNVPGLKGAILVGLTVAKSMAYLLKIPLIGINHIEAHPYANCLIHGELPFPMVHLVAAGGHTLLIHQTDHFQWEIIGRSLDDAAGECVDKIAKMFGHPMPGGPVIDKAALTYPTIAYKFPKPLLRDPHLNFSFSGLKTAVKYYIRDHEPAIEEGPVMAAAFMSVEEVLIEKTFRAVKKYRTRHVSVSGGLAASRKLKQAFEAAAATRGVNLYYPPPNLCTDNAAMVACLAAHRFEAGKWDDLELDAYANLIR